MDYQAYGQFIVEETRALMAIDSPSGMTKKAADHVMARFEALGYAPQRTRKDGVVVCLGGKNMEDAILLEAHMDTLGAMVAEIKGNGALRVSRIGGLNANNVETETCRVYTKFDGVVEGTAQLINASTHVNGKYSDTQRTFDTIEIVLDEDVKSAEDVKKLGVRNGDFVCFEPRFTVTKNGYIKSRFLDDKLSVGIVLAYAKYLKEENVVPERGVWVHVTSFEEVGHGGSASVPQGITEAISVDMGCVGEGLECTERMVSICAKDAGGPYNEEVVRGLIAAAEKMQAPYAVDLYPFYGSDVEATLRAGHDIRHGLIGAGVYASHGYERSHTEGALAALKVLIGYIG